LLASVLGSAQTGDFLLSVTNEELRDVVAKAYGAEIKTLRKWSKDVRKSGLPLKQFCPDDEKKSLARFFAAVADAKRNPPASREHQLAEANAKLEIYSLMSSRDYDKRKLRAVLRAVMDNLATTPDAAGGDGRDEPARSLAERAARSLGALDQPPPQRARISQEAAHCYQTSTVPPVYPPTAKSNRIQGIVAVRAVISREGKVVDISPLSGPQELIPGSIAAIRQWQYRPYYLWGNPVEIETQITINYVLH
jgi:hypothetical protein